jgi:hypothetical protein
VSGTRWMREAKGCTTRDVPSTSSRSHLGKMGDGSIQGAVRGRTSSLQQPSTALRLNSYATEPSALELPRLERADPYRALSRPRPSARGNVAGSGKQPMGCVWMGGFLLKYVDVLALWAEGGGCWGRGVIGMVRGQFSLRQSARSAPATEYLGSPGVMAVGLSVGPAGGPFVRASLREGDLPPLPPPSPHHLGALDTEAEHGHC